MPTQLAQNRCRPLLPSSHAVPVWAGTPRRSGTVPLQQPRFTSCLCLLVYPRFTDAYDICPSSACIYDVVPFDLRSTCEVSSSCYLVLVRWCGWFVVLVVVGAHGWVFGSHVAHREHARSAVTFWSRPTRCPEPVFRRCFALSRMNLETSGTISLLPTDFCVRALCAVLCQVPRVVDQAVETRRQHHKYGESCH